MQASAGLLVTTSPSMQAAEAYKGILTNVWLFHSKSLQTRSPANITTASELHAGYRTGLSVCVCACVEQSPLN